MHLHLKIFFIVLWLIVPLLTKAQSPQKPNIIFIYADDLGYGDLSCYGATKINTPNIDALAKQGLRFTHGHSTAATCTPSRYALITGQYPWRKEGTNILPGNASLIIPTDQLTWPKLMQQAGYKTGVVGKWHLGLGNTTNKNWNEELKPGPNEVGFDYAFIIPATTDRVPTVFIENHRVTSVDANDAIQVDYAKPVGNEPTGSEHPELLKMQSSHGHNQTIVNGIGRIGYMSGGKKARWTDEELPFTFLQKAKTFIAENKNIPFFLYYPMTEPHVPRIPATMFKGKSELGYRGDVILQLDWVVGELMNQLKSQGIEKNTLVIFTSDNGPVLDDGYMDEAVEKSNGHTAAGPLRGGKYSAFEAGTRVPFILSWLGKIEPDTSEALISQIDMFASFAFMLNQPLAQGVAPDSENVWDAMCGKSKNGRTLLVEQSGTLAIISGDWKYIEPAKGPKILNHVNIESGFDSEPQLYNLKSDVGETKNIAGQYTQKVKALSELLQKVSRGYVSGKDPR